MRTWKFSRRLLTLVVAILVTMVSAVSGTAVKAAPKNPFAPTQTIQTSGGTVEVYDLAALRGQPGLRFVTHSVKKAPVKKHTDHTGGSKGRVQPDSSASQQEGNYEATAVAELIWVYNGSSFVCGYGAGDGMSDPNDAEVNILGDLFINGAAVSPIDDTGIGFAADESGCYRGASHAIFTVDVSAAAKWPDGTYLYVPVGVSGTQPV